MLSAGIFPITAVNATEIIATIQTYLSLICFLVKIPKANNPNNGPYVYPATVSKLSITLLLSTYLKIIITITQLIIYEIIAAREKCW